MSEVLETAKLLHQSAALKSDFPLSAASRHLLRSYKRVGIREYAPQFGAYIGGVPFFGSALFFAADGN